MADDENVTEVDFGYSGPADELLKERETTHGKFEDTATIAQQFKEFYRRQQGWEKLNAIQREAMDAFGVKMARILSGNPKVKDHWDDIEGYARLVSRRFK